MIDRVDTGNPLATAYYCFMVTVISISLIPLAFKTETELLMAIDDVTLSVFIVDYALRWMTADYKFQESGIIPFLKYPFSPMAVIDLISIIASLDFISYTFRVFRIVRFIRPMRVFRAFKAMRYSKSFEIVRNVLRASKDSLMAVCILAGGYIIISSLIMFNVEPESFPTFFDAVYWTTCSLTTIGYGDIYPLTAPGKMITMLSAMFGIAIVALPAGIITAGYMNELEKNRSSKNDQND